MSIEMTDIVNVISEKLNDRPDLFLHEIHGRVDSEILAAYDKIHKINHAYDGRETHFVMDKEGDIVFIGNLYELHGFLGVSDEILKRRRK